MAKTQTRSNRKISGSRYIDYRKKKLFELGRDPTFTKIGETSIRKVRVLGGKQKLILLGSDVANLYDPKTKKYKKAKIKTVKESPANRDFVRRNILTKGSIIETDSGLARISNRPGQEGIINAVLIQK